MSSLVCRHMEPGCDPFHAGVWAATLPRSQRQRDTDHDHGLQVHCAAPCVCRVQGVSKAHACHVTPDTDSLTHQGHPTHPHCKGLRSFIYEISFCGCGWGHTLVFGKKFNRRITFVFKKSFCLSASRVVVKTFPGHCLFLQWQKARVGLLKLPEKNWAFLFGRNVSLHGAS